MRGIGIVSAICLFLGLPGVCSAYLTFTWRFESLAKAPVIVTAIVESTIRDSSPLITDERVVAAHARLLVLRTSPGSMVEAGERINLDYEARLHEFGISGPDVPNLKAGAVFCLPLKQNPDPASAAWRLIGDTGGSIVIPAMRRQPPFATPVANGREFLLREIASVLMSGSRAQVLAEVLYTDEQRGIASELVSLLDPMIGVNQDRWTLIAAAIFSSLGTPRPTVEELRAGTEASYFRGSLIDLVLQRIESSAGAKNRLIQQLLLDADIASGGAGETLTEFAQEPSLIRELQAMLRSGSPGALDIAQRLLHAGHKETLADATTLALEYLSSSDSQPSELRRSCVVIRDFGTDAQFSRLIAAVRKTQHEDRSRYDLLWRSTAGSGDSGNSRERIILDLVVADNPTWWENQK